MRLRSAVAIALAISIVGLAASFAQADGDAMVIVPASDPRVGGLSGLEVTPDGASFTAISDRGYLLTGQFERTNGVLNTISITGIRDLPGPDGGRPAPGKAGRDSEGLSITSDGRLYISFEGNHRLTRYRPDGAVIDEIALPQPDGLVDNNGFEALAFDHLDRPVVIQEGAARPPTTSAIYRLEGGEWREIAYLQRNSSFLPVGADFGPDGALYLLERKVSFTGFHSRIRRLDLTADGTVAGTIEGDIVWQPATTYGNLEGLSVWTDAEGALRATMVADDNFLPFMPGGMVEIGLDNASNGM